jgi:hypothetical protein
MLHTHLLEYVVDIELNPESNTIVNFLILVYIYMNFQTQTFDIWSKSTRLPAKFEILSRYSKGKGKVGYITCPSKGSNSWYAYSRSHTQRQRNQYFCLFVFYHTMSLAFDHGKT